MKELAKSSSKKKLEQPMAAIGPRQSRRLQAGALLTLSHYFCSLTFTGLVGRVARAESSQCAMAGAAVDPVKWEEQHWKDGVSPGTKWDVGGPSPTLKWALSNGNYASQPDSAALVPGCGRAYDALALAKHGFSKVLAVDIAPSAVKAAKAEIEAQSSSEPDAKKVEAQEADFFGLQGEYDLIWDCTFLCALPPALREQWAAKMRSLLKPKGRLIQCVFPITSEKDPNVGPPYPLTIDLCKTLLTPHGLEAVKVEPSLAPEHIHKTDVLTATTGFIEWKIAGSE